MGQMAYGMPYGMHGVPPGMRPMHPGGAYLVGGGFFEDAPNAPNGGDRKMGFVEMRWTF